MHRFWQFARPHLPLYAVGLSLLLATNALALWIPWLLRDAINALERGVELRVLAGFAVLMSGVALLQAVTRSCSRLAILGNSRKIVYDLRNAFFTHLLRLGASFYDTHRTGDIMSRGVNDIQLIQSFFGPGVLNLLNTAIVYTATIVLLVRIDARLTVIALSVVPFLFFGVNRLSRRVYGRSIAVQEQLAAISNRSQENISGIQQVKNLRSGRSGDRTFPPIVRRVPATQPGHGHGAWGDGFPDRHGDRRGDVDRVVLRRPLRHRRSHHVWRFRGLQCLPGAAQLADHRSGLDHQHLPARRRRDAAHRRGVSRAARRPGGRWTT